MPGTQILFSPHDIPEVGRRKSLPVRVGSYLEGSHGMRFFHM